jgi:hypothetical protein
MYRDCPSPKVKVRAFVGQRNAKPNPVVPSCLVNLQCILSYGSGKDYIIGIKNGKTSRAMLASGSCLDYRFCHSNLSLRDLITRKGRKDNLGKRL